MAISVSTGAEDYINQTGSRKACFANGVLRVFTSPRPANADAIETGTLLAEFTESAGAFTPGTATNGLNFGTSTGGVLSKDTSETWATVIETTGTAYWFRFYANDRITGASTSAKRFDGTCSTSEGADLQLSTLAFVDGAGASIASFEVE